MLRSCILLCAITLVQCTFYTERQCCLPISVEGLLIRTKSQEGETRPELDHIQFAYDYQIGYTSIRVKQGNVHILMEHEGYTYVSVDGKCISKTKTLSCQLERCAICTKGEHVYSSYYGAGNNKLPFDAYRMKDGVLPHSKATSGIDVTYSMITFDDDYIVPVDKTTNFELNGVKYRHQNSYMGLQTEITSPEITFEVPEGCNKGMLETDVELPQEIVDTLHSLYI